MKEERGLPNFTINLLDNLVHFTFILESSITLLISHWDEWLIWMSLKYSLWEGILAIELSEFLKRWDFLLWLHRWLCNYWMKWSEIWRNNYCRSIKKTSITHLMIRFYFILFYCTRTLKLFDFFNNFFYCLKNVLIPSVVVVLMIRSPFCCTSELVFVIVSVKIKKERENCGKWVFFGSTRKKKIVFSTLKKSSLL